MALDDRRRDFVGPPPPPTVQQNQIDLDDQQNSEEQSKKDLEKIARQMAEQISKISEKAIHEWDSWDVDKFFDLLQKFDKVGETQQKVLLKIFEDFKNYTSNSGMSGAKDFLDELKKANKANFDPKKTVERNERIEGYNREAQDAAYTELVEQITEAIKEEKGPDVSTEELDELVALRLETEEAQILLRNLFEKHFEQLKVQNPNIVIDLEAQESARKSAFNHTEQIVKIEEALKHVEVLAEIYDKLSKGESLAKEDFKIAQEQSAILKNLEHSAEDFKKAQETANEIELRSIRTIWKDLPSKLVDKLESLESTFSDMFGPEIVKVAKFGFNTVKSLGKVVFNPKQSLMATRETIATLKDATVAIVKNPAEVAAAVRDGLGMDASGAIQEKALAFQERQEKAYLRRLPEEKRRDIDLTRLAERGLRPGSIYTHDIHTEKVLNKLLDLQEASKPAIPTIKTTPAPLQLKNSLERAKSSVLPSIEMPKINTSAFLGASLSKVETNTAESVKAQQQLISTVNIQKETLSGVLAIGNEDSRSAWKEELELLTSSNAIQEKMRKSLRMMGGLMESWEAVFDGVFSILEYTGKALEKLGPIIATSFEKVGNVVNSGLQKVGHMFGEHFGPFGKILEKGFVGLGEVFGRYMAPLGRLIGNGFTYLGKALNIGFGGLRNIIASGFGGVGNLVRGGFALIRDYNEKAEREKRLASKKESPLLKKIASFLGPLGPAFLAFTKLLKPLANMILPAFSIFRTLKGDLSKEEKIQKVSEIGAGAAGGIAGAAIGSIFGPIGSMVGSILGSTLAKSLVGSKLGEWLNNKDENGVSNFEKIQKAFSNAITTVTELFWKTTGALKKIYETFSGSLGTIWKGLKEAFDGIVTLFTNPAEGMRKIGSSLSTMLEGVAGFFSTLFSNIAPKVLPFLEKLPSMLWEGIKVIGEKVINGIRLVVSHLPEIISKAFAGLRTMFQKLWADLPGILSTGFRKIGEMLPAIGRGILAAVKGLGSIIWDALLALPGLILKGISGIGSLVWDGLKALPGLIWEGLKELPNLISNAISGIGTKIKDGIKGFFGFSSSSEEAPQTSPDGTPAPVQAKPEDSGFSVTNAAIGAAAIAGSVLALKKMSGSMEGFSLFSKKEKEFAESKLPKAKSVTDRLLTSVVEELRQIKRLISKMSGSSSFDLPDRKKKGRKTRPSRKPSRTATPKKERFLNRTKEAVKAKTSSAMEAGKGALNKAKDVGKDFASKGKDLVSKGTNVAKNASSNLLDKGKTFLKSGKNLAKVGGAAAVVLGGVDLVTTLMDSEMSTKEKISAASGSVGSMAGGAIGAVAGSIVGPVGTVVGGYLGSVAGEYVGEFVGDAIASADKVVDAVSDFAGKAVDGVKDAGKWVGDKASAVADSVASFFGFGKEEPKKTKIAEVTKPSIPSTDKVSPEAIVAKPVEKTGSAKIEALVTPGIKEGAEKLKEGFKNTTEKASNLWTGLKEKVLPKTENVQTSLDKTKESLSGALETASKIEETVVDKSKELGTKAVDLTKNLSENVKEMSDNLTEGVSDLASNVKTTAEVAAIAGSVVSLGIRMGAEKKLEDAKTNIENMTASVKEKATELGTAATNLVKTGIEKTKNVIINRQDNKTAPDALYYEQVNKTKAESSLSTKLKNFVKNFTGPSDKEIEEKRPKILAVRSMMNLTFAETEELNKDPALMESNTLAKKVTEFKDNVITWSSPLADYGKKAWDGTKNLAKGLKEKVTGPDIPESEKYDEYGLKKQEYWSLADKARMAYIDAGLYTFDKLYKAQKWAKSKFEKQEELKEVSAQISESQRAHIDETLQWIPKDRMTWSEFGDALAYKASEKFDDLKFTAWFHSRMAWEKAKDLGSSAVDLTKAGAKTAKDIGHTLAVGGSLKDSEGNPKEWGALDTTAFIAHFATMLATEHAKYYGKKAWEGAKDLGSGVIDKAQELGSTAKTKLSETKLPEFEVPFKLRQPLQNEKVVPSAQEASEVISVKTPYIAQKTNENTLALAAKEFRKGEEASTKEVENLTKVTKDGDNRIVKSLGEIAKILKNSALGTNVNTAVVQSGGGSGSGKNIPADIDSIGVLLTNKMWGI